jgi:hypothetical protein
MVKIAKAPVPDRRGQFSGGTVHRGGTIEGFVVGSEPVQPAERSGASAASDADAVDLEISPAPASYKHRPKLAAPDAVELPPMGRGDQVNVSFAGCPDLLARLDAERGGLTRPEYIRRLIVVGMD